MKNIRDLIYEEYEVKKPMKERHLSTEEFVDAKMDKLMDFLHAEDLSSNDEVLQVFKSEER